MGLGGSRAVMVISLFRGISITGGGGLRSTRVTFRFGAVLLPQNSKDVPVAARSLVNSIVNSLARFTQSGFSAVGKLVRFPSTLFLRGI